MTDQERAEAAAGMRKLHPHHIAAAAIENAMDPQVFINQCCEALEALARGAMQDQDEPNADGVVFASKGAKIIVHIEAEESTGDESTETAKRFTNIPA